MNAEKFGKVFKAFAIITTIHIGFFTNAIEMDNILSAFFFPFIWRKKEVMPNMDEGMIFKIDIFDLKLMCFTLGLA